MTSAASSGLPTPMNGRPMLRAARTSHQPSPKTTVRSCFRSPMARRRMSSRDAQVSQQASGRSSGNPAAASFNRADSDHAPVASATAHPRRRRKAMNARAPRISSRPCTRECSADMKASRCRVMSCSSGSRPQVRRRNSSVRPRSV